MVRETQLTRQIFTLSPQIQVIPITHGSSDIAKEVRELLLSRRADCLAVPLPPSGAELIERGIAQLPRISLVIWPEPASEHESVCNFVPIDPCQPVIMGLRVAMTEDMARAYIDRDVTRFELISYPVPDPYSLRYVSLAAYCTALLPFLPYPKPQSQHWQRIKWMAFKLHELELDYRHIVCLCPVEDWPWLREAYRERLPYEPPETVAGAPILCSVAPSTLYFALCELPFLTALFERRRAEARADEALTVDGVKELLLESRRRWRERRSAEFAQEADWVTPNLLQQYLQYVRNLSLLECRLTPDLYTLVVAAKQMAGDDFAVTLLETAKTYCYQDDPDLDKPSLPVWKVGVTHLESPEGEVARGKNRLQGEPVVWRSLWLKPEPPPLRKRQWAYQWNPFRQCSWPPEDMRIEGFAARVREHARTVLGADWARTEKFMTSLRDGIDLRETLRQWPLTAPPRKPDIYVKEIPPSRGNVEIVIMLFEVPADPHTFSWQATWYAEHPHESTLCFYATPFLENMVGPGIGQSRYGGAFFLFPPRPIPNIWEDPRFAFTRTLEERLIAGAAAHSREAVLTLVSPISPLMSWRTIVRRFGRKLVVIPLSRFSGQTIARLRRFHVLNGHEIRSFAAQFIQG
ncbi:MAG: hypothetical protein D6704_13790 [Nitrospirae bacterium]|nr:MAG: hypothetical protein D6704_13790 [Nitrospirota bacterium]